MNVELINDLVKPFMKNNAITYDEFEKIFDMLSLHEQYGVVDVLIDSDIALVDITDSENDEFFEEEQEEVCDDIAFFQNESEVVKYNSNVKLSNTALCKLIQCGCIEAKRDLCEKNKKFVAQIARKYKSYLGHDLDIKDLEQAGYIGLLIAAVKFDAAKGNAFTTYATSWVKQSISREIYDTGFRVRVPVHAIEHVCKIRNVDFILLEKGLSKNERVEEISRLLGYSVDVVKKYLDINEKYFSSISLNTLIGEEKTDEFATVLIDESSVSPEEEAYESEKKEIIHKILDNFSEREAMVIKRRFGFGCNPMTLEEIGKEMDVTRERVRQIECKVLRKLRTPKYMNVLKELA